MTPRFCACACSAALWVRWACQSTKSEPVNGSRWICSSATMDCRKRCGCHNESSWGAGRFKGASGRSTQMVASAFWKRIRHAAETDQKEREKLVTTWVAQLKKGLAAIAMAKSSQQFGREEETK